MIIAGRTFILPDGRRLSVKSAQEGDAASLCAHRAITSAQTHFMARYPEECETDARKMIAELAHMRDHPVNFMVTAFDDGRIVGDLGVTRIRDRIKYRHRGYMGISIQHAYCGMGLGSQMVEIAIEQAKVNGFEQLELGVFDDNAAAIHLYEKHGFKRYGLQPRAFKLKDGSYHDEIIMVRFL